MELKPEFSVIMPVWNRAHRISAAIESVLAQTYRDFELILVDDGSTDNLAEAVQQFLGPNVRFVSIHHSGVSAARNTGIREARGRFIAYLDSDNSWRPRFLETVKATIDAHQDKCRVVYTIAEVHEHGLAHISGLKSLGEPFSMREMAKRNLIDQNTVVHDRACIDLVGWYDETMRCLVDWDFLTRLTARYEPFFIPEVLVDYNFGLDCNSVLLTEDPAVAYGQMAKKNYGPDPGHGRVTLSHDMINYVWDNVSTEKYDNWLRMRTGPFDYKTFHPNGYPFMLQIEPTSRCNLACPLCPVGRDALGRPKQDMPLELFKGIIDDMKRWLMFVVLWDWGEPLANPQLPEIIRYASEADIKTVTSTNAHYLGNEEFVASILTSGLSTLIVAIDSLHESQYLSYRVGGKLDKALCGLKKAVELKRKTGSRTLINMRMVVMRDNEREVGKLRREARRIGVDLFTVKTLNPSCGDVSLDAERVPQNRKLRRFEYRADSWERIPVKSACERVITMSNIFSNGDVVPCCYDFDSSMKIGNIFEKPFSSIWYSPEYQEVRRRIHEERDTIDRCRNCHINFKLSKTGWFAEATDMTAPLPFWDPRRYLSL
jgi:radical SAM protein with 4Fe4S-binding SPASM domain